MENAENNKLLMKLLERLQETDKEYYKFLIPNFLSKQLTTYMSIREDLQYTLRALKKLSLLLAENTDKKDNTVETALWYSATFTYSKCFMDATKSKMTKLELSEIFKEKKENIESHDYLLDIRNNFLAHRNDSDYEQNILYLRLPKSQTNLENLDFRFKTLRFNTPPLATIKKCITLVEDVIEIIEKKLKKKTEKLNLDFINQLKPEHLKYFIID